MIWQTHFKHLATAAALFCAAGDAALLLPRQNSATCPGYKASNVKSNAGNVVGGDLNLAGSPCNTYGTDLNNLKLLVEYQTPQRMHVKIYDAAEEVYQVPESVLPRPGSNTGMQPNQSDLQFSMTDNPFSFTISRRSTGEVIFDTSGNPMLFESQYLGLRTNLPDSPNLYGLGETTDPFRLQTINYTRTLWSRDAYGTPQYSNLYGNHPVYFDYRGQNGTHGVFLLNSNGMDIHLDKDTTGQQYLEYRTLGGVLDFYFLSGPDPKDVAMQYAEIVGLPAMMSYWAFGFHNCRYGYEDIFEVAEVIANYSAANIPLETQWTDIDYMDLRMTFTLDPYRYPLDRVQEVVTYLHNHNQHYIMMVDPAVAYQNYPAFNNGVQKNAFMKDSNGSIYKGVVWPGVTTWPDWFAPNAQSYWNGEFSTFFDPNNGVDIDALWIDMNEASNFCDFPCTHPATFAGSADDPPTPPPLRLSPPRPIPGFGPDFQPTCVAEVFFDCYAQTYYGENIFIFGNVSSFGNGNPQMAAPMGAQNYPHWQLTIQLPPNSTVSYQYIRRESDGSYIYEAKNRTLTTGDCHSGVQHVSNNITTSSGPHKRSIREVSHPPAQATKKERRSKPGSMKGLPGRDLLNPAYAINNTAGVLSQKTIQTNLIHANGLTEYDTHNLYGTMMSTASRGALLNRKPTVRPLVITRSTFAGAGSQVGHWLGDNFADWDHYRWTIGQLQEFAALFQVPMVGSDICGYAGLTNDNLCSRWVFLGAFSPFFRDHQSVGFPPHELYYSPAVAHASRVAIDIRYRLLDYAYTAFWKQSQTGSPMLNPMFFMYPSDINTATLSYQFFWGDAIMAAPVTDDNSTSVPVYFPKDQFYDFHTGSPVTGTGQSVTLTNIGFDSMPLYFKGGKIVPMRTQSAYTTTELRNQNFALVIARDASGNANGSLYLDDGDSLVQHATSNILFSYTGHSGAFQMTGEFGYNPGHVVIRNVTILGAERAGRNGHYDAANKKAIYQVDIPLTKAWNGNFES